jgi:hypothetical protein
VVCYAGFGFGGAFGWYAECAWKDDDGRASLRVELNLYCFADLLMKSFTSQRVR